MSIFIGTILANARKERKLSIQEVSDILKIRINYLKAIEKEQEFYSDLNVYKQGYVKLYADFLGIDAGNYLKLTQEYQQQIPAINVVDTDRAKPTIIIIAASLLVLLLSSLVIYWITSNNQPQEIATNPSQATLTTEENKFILYNPQLNKEIFTIVANQDGAVIVKTEDGAVIETVTLQTGQAYTLPAHLKLIIEPEGLEQIDIYEFSEDLLSKRKMLTNEVQALPSS